MKDDAAPARFLWLPPGLRPPVEMPYRVERFFLLVGIAALFAGFDMNVYGLAIPQIQASLNIPENQVGLTVSYFRLATIVAMLLAASADLVGRRRLLLVTIMGQACFTLATAFTATYEQFVWAQIFTRVFGYAEEMLCFVVISEEVAARARGWANGTISALDYVGAGLASLAFAGVTLLPYGWRSLYVIGAVPLFLVGFLRRRLPETQRFAARERTEIARSKLAETLALLGALARDYPGRVLTILVAVAALGFAEGPATVLAQKYLQSTLHYSPAQVTMLLIPGGLIGLGLTIAMGRLSDRIGRRPSAMLMACTMGLAFWGFFSDVPGWAIPPLWVLGFFGFFSGSALMAGFALEIVPTQYRATVGGLRYLVEIGAGALALALEGHLYDAFGAHGPAIRLCLVTIPVALIALLLLPEPAGRSLEEMTERQP
jgi:putative MFS transporter